MTNEQMSEVESIIESLHKFAQDTGALPGDDVLHHFTAKWKEWRDAKRAQLRAK